MGRTPLTVETMPTPVCQDPHAQVSQEPAANEEDKALAKASKKAKHD